MTTLIRKELRENFILALIGFGIFMFLLVQSYRSCTSFYANLALGQSGWSGDATIAQPLLGSFPKLAMVCCAIFGAILGWFQIHNERHRDLWAFLIHRPLSRTKIFCAKVIAGLCLYAAGAGLPLLGMILMIRIPGHIAAPFEWAMVLPVTACFLSGIVYYFAGLLTGLRQARWYASRGLGLGVAILVSVTVATVPDFWRALFLILLGGVLVASAAWGSFLSNGYYNGQPPLGRRALVASLMFGGFVVVMFGMVLLESLVPNPFQGSFHWSRYQMTKDGEIYKMDQPAGKTLQITKLNGTPLKDIKTGRPITLTDFNRLAVSESSIRADFEDQAQYQKRPQGRYVETSRFFSLWRQTPDTLWYWNRNGRLWGYDLASRRFIGSLGPGGFTPGLTTGPDRFSRKEGYFGNGYYNSSYPARTLMTDNAVYKLNFENRTARVFFAATNNDRIGGAFDVSLNGYDWNYTIIVTREFIQLLNPDGKLVWQTAYVPAYPAYDGVAVSFLEATNRFALWLNANGETNRLKGWTLPSHVVWLAAGQGALESTNLPSLSGYQGWTPTLTERLLRSVVPPAFYSAPIFLYDTDFFRNFPWKDFLTSVVAAAVCAGIGWCQGRRYHFTVGGQLKWAGFHLLFGLPGLLGFLCAQEWPTRESCPKCKNLRLVDREKCEHCGADFAPPPRNGTEIFEPIGAG
ncbi:MAG TPA: ABC transporter permease [Verrucomicrobiae bacterium]|nr:ABC transporter permease [Verrucomicrobiae bacterium]